MPKFEYDFVGQKTLTDAGYAEACQAADDYSVSLINGNKLIGSATLVSIGKVHGLLTADHVWQTLRKGDDKDLFCIVLGSQLQRFEYPFQQCMPFIVGEYSPEHAEEGPDLTFIRLDDPLKLGTIKSRKLFYPLDSENLKVFSQIPFGRCPWVVWGAPGEQSRRSSTDAGEPILRLRHFAGAGDFIEKVERNEFDYVKIKITSGTHDFPGSYGGVSGGGVWIPIRFSEDPEGRTLKPSLHLLLAGVAYLQIEEEANFKTLALHGPKSIYQAVINSVLGQQTG